MLKAAIKVMLLQSPQKQRLLDIITPYCPADKIPRTFIQHVIKTVRPVQEKVARALDCYAVAQ